MLGPLIQITGEMGPRMMGLSRNAFIADAIRGDEWWISGSRSRNPLIQLLKSCLPSLMWLIYMRRLKIIVFLWKIGDKEASNVIFSSATWFHLNPPGPRVDWYKSVWFEGRIPNMPL